MMANKACAVQMLEVAFSLRMCCSRVCKAMRKAGCPWLSTLTPIILPGSILLKSSLVAKKAAILITDSEAPDSLFKIALDLLKQKEKCELLSIEIKKIQKLNATADIVDAFENSLIENGTK